MANIPVERKGGTPWWTWLLALLAVIGLIWLITALFGDEPDADGPIGTEDDIGMMDDTELGDDGMDDMAATGAITSFAALAEGATNVGRDVDLDGMNVVTLTGDSSFVIGPGTNAGQGALVVLTDLGEWRVGPGDGSDGEYDVNEGNTLDIEGTVRAFDESVPDYAEMPSADRDRAMQQGVYISAGSVDLMKNMNGTGMNGADTSGTGMDGTDMGDGSADDGM